MIQQSRSWGEKKKPNSKKKNAPQCSQKHYLQLPRQGSSLSAHQQMTGLRCGMYIQWSTTQPSKEMQFGHLQQHNGLGGEGIK